MNKSQRWLWLVLVSSIQLIVLLLVTVSIYLWLERDATHILDQQSCLNNVETLDRINDFIDVHRIIDLRSNANPELQQLEAEVAKLGHSNACSVFIFDWGQQTPISIFSSNLELNNHDLWNREVYDARDGSAAGRLNKLLSIENRNFSGWQINNNEKILLSARLLPRHHALLVVARPPLISSITMASVLQVAHSRAFTITLVVGLICISITTIIVNRVSETVNSLNHGLERVVSTSTSELIRTKNAVIFGLAKLAESRDNDTGEHLERIRIYVTILAKELGLSRSDFDERFIHDLGLASSLHDIGKVGIPDSILLKPGRLTREERGIMELHTLIGGECLDAIQARLGDNEFMSIARQIAYYHHEKWDGTGYPHSLKGTEIPLVARIVSVADVYDALTSKRPYKRAMSHEESRNIIVEGSGKHFDPEIVQAFLKHEKEFEAVSIHQQSLTDEQATSNFQRLCEAARTPEPDETLTPVGSC
jgi:HD-GYP domain-containing protein (c-di-GMP phosphodiesterase class II)